MNEHRTVEEVHTKLPDGTYRGIVSIQVTEFRHEGLQAVKDCTEAYAKGLIDSGKADLLREVIDETLYGEEKPHIDMPPCTYG